MASRTLKAVGFAGAITLLFSWLSAARMCGYALYNRKTYCSISDASDWVFNGASSGYWLTVALFALLGLAILAKLLRDDDDAWRDPK